MAETGEVIEVDATPVQIAPANLFGTSDPKAMLARAAGYAKTMTQVIKDQHLYKTISGKNHVLVEAWTFLGSMLGVFPVVAWSRQLRDEDGTQVGWEARVEAKTITGAVVGSAEASCLYSERNWANKDDFALRSMAQTRATSKALRLPLGFVVVLAGYEATPAEEMVPDEPAEALERKSKATSITDHTLEEHLEAAKATRERAAKNFIRPDDPPSIFEAVADQVEAKRGKPKDVPDNCPHCGSIIETFEKGGEKYWECHTRHMDRYEGKKRGDSEAQIKERAKGHFFKWGGKK